jgi:hypothetical protein
MKFLGFFLIIFIKSFPLALLDATELTAIRTAAGIFLKPIILKRFRISNKIFK